MATLTTLLLGAVAGAAGTWAYLRRQTEQAVEIPESPTAAPAAQAEDTAEGDVIDATAASN